MLSIALYEYGKINGRNDYTHTQQQNKVLDTILRIASEHVNFPTDELIKLVEKENIVLRYILNENDEVIEDKMAQDLICAILLSSYDEDEIDAILSELDCSE